MKTKILIYVLASLLIICIFYIGFQHFQIYKSKVFNQGMEYTIQKIINSIQEHGEVDIQFAKIKMTLIKK